MINGPRRSRIGWNSTEIEASKVRKRRRFSGFPRHCSGRAQVAQFGVARVGVGERPRHDRDFGHVRVVAQAGVGRAADDVDDALFVPRNLFPSGPGSLASLLRDARNVVATSDATMRAAVAAEGWPPPPAVSRKPRENPGFSDFGGLYFGRIPADSAPSWTVDHLCTSSRDRDTKIARIDSYKVMLNVS